MTVELEDATAVDAPVPPVPPGRVAVLGIRHHGPGSARSVLAALDVLRPTEVLIEGPADADPLLVWASHEEMMPPVALFAHAVDDPRHAVFWPFAVFSPEWQAIRWAIENDAPVRFCDLPSGAVLAGGRAKDDPRPGETLDEPESDSGTPDAPDRGDPAAGPDRQLRDDPIALLAEAAGYDDPERWWDDVVESRAGGLPAFDALTEAMAEIRAHTSAVGGPTSSSARREDRREAYMRQTIRAALRRTEGTVAVVCGAWHAPALVAPLPPVGRDAALLRGLIKLRTGLSWVPWTHRRLSAMSGYGAGITSPGFYHHLFSSPDHSVQRWMTAVATRLREQDLPVSTAHVIEAVRLADALAALRSRPAPGLHEVRDATLAVLCDGDPVSADFVGRELEAGELLGDVPADSPAVPISVDLLARARSLRLKMEAVEKVLDLDLRKDTDRGKSILLHRLSALDIPWGEPAESARQSTGTFTETWLLRWEPELAVAVVDAAVWGSTVESAAIRRVTERARTGTALATLTAQVEVALLADLPSVMPAVLAALDRQAARQADIIDLMRAAPALVRAVRYGDVRGTDTSALTAVVAGFVVRVTAGFPAAVTGLGDDAAADLRTVIDEWHAALDLYARQAPTGDRRASWYALLLTLVDRRDLHGLLSGRLTRVLVDNGRIPSGDAARRFAAHLSIGPSAVDKARWVEGFLSGTGLLLIHDPDLLGVLDAWLAGLGEQDFLDVLPLLRRTFGQFSPPERNNIGAALSGLGRGRVLTSVEVDADRAAPVLRTIAAILGGGR